jgi:hypothetical protein
VGFTLDCPTTSVPAASIEDTTTPDEPENDHNENDDQEQVDQVATEGCDKRPEQPQNDQNQDDRFERITRHAVHLQCVFETAIRGKNLLDTAQKQAKSAMFVIDSAVLLRVAMSGRGSPQRPNP